MYLSDIINENKRIELRKLQNVKLRNELRFYKGKYPCKILCKGKKKALVLWLCYCDVVGSKELGYKSVSVFDIDVINSMRLLHEHR